MPELPEVETTRRGIEPHCRQRCIKKIIVRDRRLRWPVTASLEKQAQGAVIESIQRRAKYLLLYTTQGNLIIHLGMSGSLRILDHHTPAAKHDHIDIILDDGQALRFRDPRRFGSVLWTRKDPLQHPRLTDLGPEPLSEDFNTDALHKRAKGRKQAIKTFIMDSRSVVGVGNIYACESLFMSGIHPNTAAGKISAKRMDKLVSSIKTVLATAIEQGGTTLKDFTGSDGQPGYFAQSLNVYGREGEACLQCKRPVRRITQGQRSTFYCPGCQK